MNGAPARRMFTTSEYHRMGEAGILTDEDRVELIEGEIIRLTPIGPPQASTVDRLNPLFHARAGNRAIVRVQGPIVRDRYSEPQPDLTLLKPRADFYVARHPQPTDVLLAVEVMHTSADYDRGVKFPLYARRGIAEVWLIDVVTRTVTVGRQPTLRGYRDTVTRTGDERLAPAALPRVAFRVSELLGR
jgi:Uma2 family endonuclease